MRNIYSLNTRHVFITLMLFVALAVGFLLLFPGGFAQAQDASNIPYQENGTGPVTTFTATDPEGGTIYWSLLENHLSEGSPIQVDGEALEADDVVDHTEFSISAQGVLTFNIPPDYESTDDAGDDNVYNIVVVASDDAPGAGGTMAYKKVTIMVTDVPEPGIVTLSSLQPQVEAPLTAMLIDSEVDTPTPTWKWEKSQDMSSWTPIDSVSLPIRTPDATTEGYYLRATATYDDEKRTAQAVSVNKVRAAPTTTDAPATFPAGTVMRNVAENSPAGTNVGDPVKANDSADDVLTYSLTGEGGFQINPATGQITVGPRTILDADDDETDGYTVTVTATEANERNPEASTPVEITVNNVNEAPMVAMGLTMLEKAEDNASSTDDDDDGTLDTDDSDFLAVSTYTASDPEDDTPPADVTWTLQGADASKFDISAAGALVFKGAPNYEMPADAGRNNVYNVTVVATDAGVDGKNKMTATRAVTIMVTNVKEDGTVTLSQQQPQVGVPLTASVTDLDGAVTDVTWKWERDDDETDDAANAGAEEEVIGGATSATYTPTSNDAGSYLRAIATYTDPQGKGTFSKTSAAIVTLRTDNAPKFGDTESGKRFIAENQDAEALVVAASDGTTPVVANDPVQAMDAEDDQLLTYRLSGADAGSFTITSDTAANARGGQIAAKAKLDYEAKSTYRVTVTATDPDNHRGSIDVTIMVIDMNEAPEVTGDAAKDYPENQTRDVASYTATDPEDGTIYWSLLLAESLERGQPEIQVDGEALEADADDGGPHRYFSISAQRRAYLQHVRPDHEMPTERRTGDTNNTNTYNIVVVASDDAPGAAGGIDGLQEGDHHGHRCARAGHCDPVIVAAPGWDPADGHCSSTPK